MPSSQGNLGPGVLQPRLGMEGKNGPAERMYRVWLFVFSLSRVFCAVHLAALCVCVCVCIGAVSIVGLARLATQSSRAQTPGAFDIAVDVLVLVIFLRVPYLPRARFVDCFIDKLRFMGT